MALKNSEVYQKASTNGDFTDEDDALAAFDVEIARFGRFNSHKQVWGKYQFHLPWKDYSSTSPVKVVKDPRIDRILMPKLSFIKDGWVNGPIGIEAKRSDKKIGPPAAQAIDYRDAIWEIATGTWLRLFHIFLFPVPTLYGDLSSILVQQRIVTASFISSGLIFQMDQVTILNTGDKHFKEIRSGTKVGSR